MQLTRLTVLSFSLVACDPRAADTPINTNSGRDAQSSYDAESPHDAGGTDAGSTLFDPTIPAPQRATAECSELGMARGTFFEIFELRSDYFNVCNDDAEDADRAFNWTAPATGFYQATASPPGDNAGSRVLLELREGLCNESAESALACGTPIYGEGGETSAGIAFYAEEGDSFTLIVDSAEHRVGGNYSLNEFSLDVQSVSCPGTELGGPLPAVAELSFGTSVPAFRPSSCRETSSDKQRAVSFVAPQTGSYRFQVAAEPDEFRSEAPQFSLLMLDGSCLGEELACVSGDTDGGALEMVRDLEQGERVVVLIDGNLGSVSEHETAIFTVDFATPTDAGATPTDAGSDGGF